MNDKIRVNLDKIFFENLKNSLVNEIEDGWGIFWLKDEIKFAKIANKIAEFYDNFKLNEDEILEARIFNKDKEIYLFRRFSELEAWLMDDENKEKEDDFLEETINLLGSNPTPLKDGFYKLEAESGSSFILPLDKEYKTVKIVRRNYLVTSENSQVSYGDFRLVEIKGE
ncbi:type III-D CRISPR-associated protein Csx19 [Campylobacter geochelonis]|uniref:type III-D CRISPR-associated protein Csx19 n=1 Tax=Campylobacter geochelonis TaxID=1780362 RepID=UPI000770B558|nr:CRISPR-associated protein Csx19 [Campylobacter geochelonis]CZE50718.1 CRISPR-associated protein [Campylobacter geochelonis]